MPWLIARLLNHLETKKRHGFLMIALLSFRSLAALKRPNRWADLRGLTRVKEEGRFAGLEVGGKYHIVRLHDWSPEGACVDARGAHSIGERVKLTSGTLNRRGRICWIAKERAGIEFDTEVDSLGGGLTSRPPDAP